MHMFLFESRNVMRNVCGRFDHPSIIGYTHNDLRIPTWKALPDGEEDNNETVGLNVRVRPQRQGGGIKGNL